MVDKPIYRNGVLNSALGSGEESDEYVFNTDEVLHSGL